MRKQHYDTPVVVSARFETTLSLEAGVALTLTDKGTLEFCENLHHAQQQIRHNIVFAGERQMLFDKLYHNNESVISSLEHQNTPRLNLSRCVCG